MVFDQIAPTPPNLGRFVARHAKLFHARRLDPRVRLTRGAIHRDIVSHIRRLERPAKHPLAGPPLGRPQPHREVWSRAAICSAKPLARLRFAAELGSKGV